MLEIGDKAPEFSAVTGSGERLSLSDLKGKQVILYFYPKDDTPGCTTEACGFRDLLPDFSAAKAEIVGVSRDSVKRHANFAAKYELPFALLSDEEGTICEAYGTWVEKKNYGRTYMGIERSTFLIDADGNIARVWRKVKVPGHVEEVLEAARSLS